LGKIETRKARRVDLQHGRFQLGIGAQQLGVETPSVVKHGVDPVGVEHMAERGEDMSLGRDKHPGLIGFEALKTAGPVDFDDFRFDPLDGVK